MMLFLALKTWGVLIGGLAMFVFLISSLLKTKRQILLDQTFAHTLLIISEAIMKTYSSIVQELVSIIRNLFVIKNKNTKVVNIILILIGTIFGLVINIVVDGNSWYGYLPIIANFEYSVVVISPFNRPKYIKLSLALSSYLWAIFFLVTANYLAGIFNVITATISLVSSLYLLIKDLKKEEFELERSE